MNEDLVYLPGADDDSFLALSSSSTYSRSVKGKLYKKHILSTGPLYYPGIKGGKVDVDDTFLQRVVRNFENKVRPIVQVPIVGDNNAHTEDPKRNIGEVVGLSVENGKLYSIIDVRDETAAPKMGKTLIGASGMLSLNATDNRTGQKAGPTLIHVVVTNNPHVNELEEFEELLAASSHDSSEQAVLLSSAPIDLKESAMDLDTLIATLRDEHGIDVPALQRSASEAESFAKLSETLQETLAGSEVLKLSDSDTSAEDIVAAVATLAEERVELSNKVNTLVKESLVAKAETRVDELVGGGFITPAKRDASVKLLLSNSELFEELLPESPIVELSSEEGRETKEEDHDVTVEAEIVRLTESAKAQGIAISS